MVLGYVYLIMDCLVPKVTTLDLFSESNDKANLSGKIMAILLKFIFYFRVKDGRRIRRINSTFDSFVIGKLKEMFLV